MIPEKGYWWELRLLRSDFLQVSLFLPRKLAICLRLQEFKIFLTERKNYVMNNVVPPDLKNCLGKIRPADIEIIIPVGSNPSSFKSLFYLLQFETGFLNFFVR